MRVRGGIAAGWRTRTGSGFVGDPGQPGEMSPVRPSFFLNPFEDRESRRGDPERRLNILKGLILAQNERWRRGLGMQVERVRLSGRASGGRVSNATVTNPEIGYSRGKLRVIPSDASGRHRPVVKAPASWDGLSWY